MVCDEKDSFRIVAAIANAAGFLLGFLRAQEDQLFRGLFAAT
jgi:hypothetical protein